MIQEHLDKNNLHHAYLIEGAHEKIVPEVLEFVESLGIKTIGNPDFCHISLDSFKIEDARSLKSYAMEKGFSLARKIFVISTNNFLLEAQNSLLKMFEEPIENTHFFVVVPDTKALLKTLISRFYLISAKPDLVGGMNDIENFINMPLQKRIDFLKEFLLKKEEENEEDANTESSNLKALKFLNKLELTLHRKMSKGDLDISVFEHFLKVREFLRMPGSSAKTLMESVALVVPNF